MQTVSPVAPNTIQSWDVMQGQQIWCYIFLPLGGYSQKINWRLSVPDLNRSIFVLVLARCIWFTQYDVRHVSPHCPVPSVCVCVFSSQAQNNKKSCGIDIFFIHKCIPFQRIHEPLNLTNWILSINLSNYSQLTNNPDEPSLFTLTF